MNICEMNSLNVYVVSEVMKSFLPKPKVFLSFCEAFEYLIGEIKIIFNYKGSEANIQDLFDCLIEYHEICFSDCGMRNFLAFWEQNYGFSKKGKGIWLSYKDWFYSVEKKEANTK